MEANSCGSCSGCAWKLTVDAGVSTTCRATKEGSVVNRQTAGCLCHGHTVLQQPDCCCVADTTRHPNRTSAQKLASAKLMVLPLYPSLGLPSRPILA